MTFRVWILRHGEAHPQAASDAERALTVRGQADAALAGAWLAAQPVAPRHVLASPYRRAQQTATAVVASLAATAPGAVIETVDWLTPDVDPRQALRELAHHDGDLLLVSHMPLVGALIGLLVDGETDADVPLPTAGLAALDMDVVGPGVARLRTLRYPPDFQVAQSR